MSEEERETRIHCPWCSSIDWTCVDENTRWFRDKETGEDYQYPVGLMRCEQCGRGYMHTDATGEDVNDEYAW